MRRCLIGKSLAKLLSLALAGMMILTAVMPAESFAASADKKGVKAEVEGEQLDVGEELKEEKADEESFVIQKEEKTDSVKVPKKVLYSDTLKVALKAVPVNQKAYKNKDGGLKVTFQLEWEDEEIYKAMVADGWKFSFELKDIASGKDMNYAEGKKFKVTSDQNKGYSMTITAEKDGEETQTFTAKTSRFVFPAKVKKVTANCPKDSRTVTVKWKKVSGAIGYYIYRNTKKSKPSKPYKEISKGSTITFKDKKLKGKKTYYYWVQTIKSYTRKGEKYKTVSALSKPDKAVVNKFLTCKIRTIKWYTTTKSKTKIYKSKTGSAVKKTVPKNTKIFVPFINPRKPNKRVYSTNYKGWINRSVIGEDAIGDVAYIKKKALDWSKEEKEAFVNKKGYSSSTGYLSWTSQYTQRVNIFKGKKGHWKLIKTMRCTTGRWSRRTGNGSKLMIRSHQARKDKTSETGYRYYYINLSIINGNAFHSPAWRFGTKHCIKDVKRNLQPDTAGCTRMSVADSSYIYHNIPLHTRVVIY